MLKILLMFKNFKGNPCQKWLDWENLNQKLLRSSHDVTKMKSVVLSSSHGFNNLLSLHKLDFDLIIFKKMTRWGWFLLRLLVTFDAHNIALF